MIVVLPSQRLVLVIQKVNKAAAICNFHQVWSFNKAWLDKNGKRMTWVDWFVTWSQSLQINKLHNSAVLVYVSTFVSFWIFLNFVKRIYGQLIGFGSVHAWFQLGIRACFLSKLRARRRYSYDCPFICFMKFIKKMIMNVWLKNLNICKHWFIKNPSYFMEKLTQKYQG